MNAPIPSCILSQPAPRSVAGQTPSHAGNGFATPDTVASPEAALPAAEAKAIFAAAQRPRRIAGDLVHALAFVARSRALLIRAQDGSLLFDAICDEALDTGDYTGAWYTGAWIAQATSLPARSLHVFAARGNTPGLQTSLTIDESDANTTAQSARLALSTARHVVFHTTKAPSLGNSLGHLVMAPEDTGLALPIRVQGSVWGVLVLHARHEHAFDAHEVRLLREFAEDLGYRLGALLDQDQQSVAAKALRRSNTELQARLNDCTAALDRNARELNAISYSIAHDLRAPLRSIDGFAHILNAQHARQLDDEARNYLERVRGAAQRMGAIIDHTLDLAHLANIRIRREEVDLSRFAADICAALAGSEPQRRVQAHIEPDVLARADAGLLREVLGHLLGNAWKFTHTTPEARIEFGLARDPQGEPFYFVRDNGVGFDMHHAANLFRPFSRLSDDEELSGMGIGLATVARIIERHGGKIWAHSSIGEGATFCFTLRPAA